MDSAATEYRLVLDEEFDAFTIEVPPNSSPKYPGKLHARKVATQLAETHGITQGLVYLPGEPTRFFEDSDMSPSFRQRRYFFYLCGANFANCAVTYDIARDHLTLWIPYTDPKQVLWYGVLPSIAECLKRFDVDDVRYTVELDAFLTALPPDGCVYSLHPDQIPLLQSLPKTCRLNTTILQPCIDEARVIKTDYEVAMIRRANDISSVAHRRVAERLLSFTNERAIEATFAYTCTANGARTQAYQIIAGSGPNASMLHYGANDDDLAGRDLVVVDAGCEWNCYASDITRTLPLRGSFSPESATIYRLVEQMQEECIALVRPGIMYHALHLHACSVALQGLLRLGILRGDNPREIWEAGTVAAFFPHGLGHHVGLETHDVSGRSSLMVWDESGPMAASSAPSNNSAVPHSRKRLYVSPDMLQHAIKATNPRVLSAVGRQLLRKNMVLTVEPGIYFCRPYLEGYFKDHATHSRYIDWGALERYYPVGGVRIEDDILVTEDGYKNLTAAPKGDEMLRIVQGHGA